MPKWYGLQGLIIISPSALIHANQFKAAAIPPL
jgi:hypothetical protein